MPAPTSSRIFAPFRAKVKARGFASARTLAAGFLLALAALAALLYLTGCAARAPRAALPPAPATAAVAEVRRAQIVVREKLVPAQARTETIIRTVETIRETADPATAEALANVTQELFKVRVELRETAEASAAAEAKAAEAEQQAETLRAWGIAQQSEAATNGEGWRKSATAERASKASADRWATAYHLRTAKLGLLGAAAGFFLGIKFFPVPPLKWWCGLGFATAAGAAAATFL
jgi:hypothetical protein